MALPLDRFLNLIYYYATEGATSDDRQKFDNKLNMPPVGVQRLSEASPWTKQNEEASLSSLAAAVGGGL